MTQQPLTFLRPSKPELRVGELIQALDGRGWRSGKILAQVLGTDDRTIRAIANASEGQIIGGQKGYCLCRQASVEEVQHAANWLRHQAQRMTTRAMEIEKAMHRRSA